MNKRGQGEAQHTFLAMEVVLGILVAGILVFSAANADAQSNVNRLYAQQDLTLLAETIDAAPGSIDYDYSIKSIYAVTYDEAITVTKSDEQFAFSYYNISLEKQPGESIQVAIA